MSFYISSNCDSNFTMTIKLDYLVIYIHNHNKSAQLFASLMNLTLDRIADENYFYNCTCYPFQ